MFNEALASTIASSVALKDRRNYEAEEKMVQPQKRKGNNLVIKVRVLFIECLFGLGIT